jgi:hypothetical protein
MEIETGKRKIGNITEKWNVVKRFQSMSPMRKVCVAVYGVFALGSFCTYTYNDGKKALVEFSSTNYSNADEEWICVKEACQENLFYNFWCSIVFPATFISNVFPSLVLWLNRKNE